jgi:hypothetical protein
MVILRLVVQHVSSGGASTPRYARLHQHTCSTVTDISQDRFACTIWTQKNAVLHIPIDTQSMAPIARIDIAKLAASVLTSADGFADAHRNQLIT